MRTSKKTQTYFIFDDKFYLTKKDCYEDHELADSDLYDLVRDHMADEINPLDWPRFSTREKISHFQKAVKSLKDNKVIKEPYDDCFLIYETYQDINELGEWSDLLQEPFSEGKLDGNDD